MGATLAFMILEKNIGDVVLVDVLEGLAKGKALDMMEAGAILGFENGILGTEDYSHLSESEIVVITAGMARKPGMSRLDLLRKNSVIVGSVVEEIVRYAPEAIIIVVTNPLDVMTYITYRKSNFPSSRVIGQAGVLDTARFKYFMAMECKTSPSDISTMILGGHGDSMVPVISRTTVSGKPAAGMLDRKTIELVVQKTRSGGAEIVSLLKTGSAYYAPASSVLAMIEAIINDTGEVMPCSAYLNGEYGLRDIYIGVPVRLGKGGMEEVIEIELSHEEKEALHVSAGIYRESIKEILK